MEEKTGISSSETRPEPSLREHIHRLTQQANRFKDDFLWPAVSLLAVVRPLHHLALRNILKIENGQRVLEVGAGYPLYKIYSDNVGKDGLFVTVDISERNQNNSKKLGYWFDRFFGKNKDVGYVTADATELPFEGDTFDTIVSSNLTVESQQREQYLKEAFRVLKPGGKLLSSITELLGIPVATRKYAKYCKKAGFTRVKTGIGVTGQVVPPGLTWNWHLEAIKPND